MLIHIINGTYGHRPVLPNGEYSNYVVPVTREDLPIDVAESEAKRLVESGIAEYVDAAPVATPVLPSGDESPNGNTPDDGDGEEDAETPEIEPLFSIDMRADTLREAMRERGLSVKIGMTKAEMVKALNEQEAPPELSAQDVIEE